MTNQDDYITDAGIVKQRDTIGSIVIITSVILIIALVILGVLALLI